MKVKSLNITIKRPMGLHCNGKSIYTGYWESNSNIIAYWDSNNYFTRVVLPSKCTSLNTSYTIKNKAHFSMLILTKKLYYAN